MFFLRHAFEIPIILAVVFAHALALRRLWPDSARRRYLALFAVTAFLGFSLALDSNDFAEQFPVAFGIWFRMIGVWYLMVSFGLGFVWLVDHTLISRLGHSKPGSESPVSRRALLTVARSSMYALPAVAVGYGSFIEKNQLKLVETDLYLPNLPQALDGLRIVQITDVHMGMFLSPREFERVVGMANETRAHLAIMTGDLVTGKGDPVDACVNLLAQVKADAGMYGCMGNHEIYAESEDYTEEAARRKGIQFLRSRSAALTFRGHTVNLAGVDYQRKTRGYLQGAEALVRSDAAVNILLSHNPDVFPVAEAKGFDLVLAGHTHGGQVTVEFLQQYVNPARFFTPFVSGPYYRNEAAAYVSRGVGTVGVPTRICAPPEVSIIQLRAGSLAKPGGFNRRSLLLSNRHPEA